MKKESIELANYRLEKAKNTFSDAEKYIKDATLDSTVNRIYYAIFYAVNALLITKGLFSSKHSGVRGLFNQEFIKTGLAEWSAYWKLRYKYKYNNKGNMIEMAKYNSDKSLDWKRKYNYPDTGGTTKERKSPFWFF